MRKTRLFCLILLLAFVLTSINAADVVGIGYGKTKEEALSNSRKDLVKQFGTNISSLDISSDTDKGDGNISSEMKSMSIESTTFTLIGQKEEVKEESKGSFVAYTTIPMNSLAMYEAKVNDLIVSSKALYEQIQKSGGNATQNQYVSLITTLNDYEKYRSVVLALNPNSKVGQTVLGISRAAIEAEYQAILMKEINENQITVNDLQLRSELGILDMEGEAKLKNALAQIEANKKAQDELAKASQEEYKHRLTQLEQSAQVMMMQVQMDTSSVESNSKNDADTVSSYINRIEGNRSTVSSLIQNLTSDLRPIYSEYNSQKRAKTNEVNNRPYEDYELYFGSPTDEAKASRQKEIEQGVKEIFEISKQKGTAVYNKYYSQIMKVNDYSLSLIEELNNKEFSLDSTYDEVTSIVEGFADAGFYYGTTYVTIGNNTFTFYFKIPYESWTGEKIPSMSDYTAYKAYRESAKKWLEFFQLFPHLYDVSFNFTVKAQNNGQYTITFKDYSVTNNYNNKVVVKEDRINQTDSLTYKTSIVFGEVKTGYDEIVDLDAVKKEYEKYVASNTPKTEKADGKASESFIYIPNLTKVAALFNLPNDWEDPEMKKYNTVKETEESIVAVGPVSSVKNTKTTEETKKTEEESSDIFKVKFSPALDFKALIKISEDFNIAGFSGKMEIIDVAFLRFSANLSCFSEKDSFNDTYNHNYFVGLGANLDFKLGSYLEIYASGFGEYCVTRSFGYENASPLSYGVDAGISFYPEAMGELIGMSIGYSYRSVDDYTGGMIALGMRIRTI